MILRLLFQVGGLENWILWHFQWGNSPVSLFSPVLWNIWITKVYESYPVPQLYQWRIMCFLDISQHSKLLGSDSLSEKPPWECCFQHPTLSLNRSQRPPIWVFIVIGCSATVLVPCCLQAEIVQSNFVMKNYNKTVGSVSCKNISCVWLCTE